MILADEKYTQGEIGIVFVDHDYIIDLNKKYLNKDDTTDVLSFPLTEPGSSDISGEIYINLDRIAEQVVEYKVSFNEELYRIIIHGLLHLVGYTDYQLAEKKKMTIKEDHYLTILKQKEFY